jgi:hypothetical protein
MVGGRDTWGPVGVKGTSLDCLVSMSKLLDTYPNEARFRIWECRFNRATIKQKEIPSIGLVCGTLYQFGSRVGWCGAYDVNERQRNSRISQIDEKRQTDKQPSRESAKGRVNGR